MMHGLGFPIVFKGLLGVAPIFWTVAVIEILTFTPMLGSGGSYLGFVTGNLTNLKVPCALYAMETAGVKQGTEAGEIISTIAIATSSIVTHRDHCSWCGTFGTADANFECTGLENLLLTTFCRHFSGALLSSTLAKIGRSL